VDDGSLLLIAVIVDLDTILRPLDINNNSAGAATVPVIVAIFEAPNDEAIALVLYSTGSLGNVRAETLKASLSDKTLCNFPSTVFLILI
jgi:hypothetical protein